jgi:hypothetical protein
VTGPDAATLPGMTRRARLTLTLALVAATPLTIAACGGDDDAGGGDTRQRIIDEMMAGEDAEGPTAEQAECMADGIIDALGEDRANELLEVEGDAEIEDVLTPDEQATFAQLGVGCVDARAMMTEQMVASGMSEEEAECVVDAIGDEQLEEMMEAEIAGGTADPAAIADAVTTCMTP